MFVKNKPKNDNDDGDDDDNDSINLYSNNITFNQQCLSRHCFPSTLGYNIPNQLCGPTRFFESDLSCCLCAINGGGVATILEKWEHAAVQQQAQVERSWGYAALALEQH
jgi:hypothetical protein